jgi:predicted nuclease with RNAse H fold
MHVLGVDLAGPAGSASTGFACFKAATGRIEFSQQVCNGTDAALYGLAEQLSHAAPVIIGLDAPLSYQPGGGQRRRDAQLRKLIVERGMRPGSVMAPTAPRMVYLTLRGVALAGTLTKLVSRHPIHIVEVHPGATLCLRGAPLDAVRTFANNPKVRSRLLWWLQNHGLHRIKKPVQCTSHFVAACAAALAAWSWHIGSPCWCARSELPWHPYDLAA